MKCRILLGSLLGDKLCMPNPCTLCAPWNSPRCGVALRYHLRAQDTPSISHSCVQRNQSLRESVQPRHVLNGTNVLGRNTSGKFKNTQYICTSGDTVTPNAPKDITTEYTSKCIVYLGNPESTRTWY
jgi:hypothetical protein